MKEFEKLKAEYDATPIPQELNDRIQQGMRQGRRRRVLRICRRSLGTAAACLVVAVGVLNVSPRWPPPPRTSRCWVPCSRCSPSGHMIRPKTGSTTM